MTLNELQTGESAIIINIRGSGAFRKRITEMGFVNGQRVKVIKSAPFKDPIEYYIMSGTVSLRRSEASEIEITRILPKKDGPYRPIEPIYTESYDPEQAADGRKKIRIALIGNPNSGKTTIYNRLSRSHEHVGNYSGVTIGSKETKVAYKGYEVSFTDLPGTYSLSAYSEEELIVRKYLNEEKPDIIVNVVDAGNIERHLYLTTQLIDMGMHVVMALNMYDDLEEKGDKLDIELLGRLLGMPIVPTIGKKGKGVYRLLNRIIKVYEAREPALRHTHINYREEIENSIHKVEDELKQYCYGLAGKHLRYYAIRALERDDFCMHTLSSLQGFEDSRPLVMDEISRLETLFRVDSETLISNARYAFIHGALKETYKKSKSNPALSRSQKIDRILTHKYFGFPIFLLILFGMFEATFVLGKYPMGWIESGVDLIGNMLYSLMDESMFRDLLIDGIIGGVGGVIVFLPNILILFFIISLMEDTGYMARTAFIMDRVMHLFGLHGKSFIPLIMGFGCNVPAMMATRTLENKQERILTMLIIPFMSCSARLPVYIIIAGAVFPEKAAFVIFSMYLIGILFSIIMATIFKTTLFKKSEAPFVMELPLYRTPGMRVVIRHMWFKGALYLKKMGGVILLASLIIWALGYFPLNVEYSKDYSMLIRQEMEKITHLENSMSESEGSEIELKEMQSSLQSLMLDKENEAQEHSYIGRMGKFIEPVIAPLGFDWKMGVSLIAGFAAKEVVVSTMGVLYQVNDAENNSVSLQEKLRDQVHTRGKYAGQAVYSPLAAFSFLLFVLLYLPCISVVATVGREAGSWKWSAFVMFYTTGLAWLVSFIVFQAGSLF